MLKKELLYDRVYRTLKQEIEDGIFQPGQRLPTEQELMERFGVSRVTTNRALKMLTNEGRIQRKAGVGTFASGNDPNAHHISPASNPFRSSRGLIGFVIPDVGVGYGAHLVVTAQRLLQQKGMTLVLACSHGEQSVEQEVIERLVESGVEGLLIFPADGAYYNHTILKLYIEHLPMVILDKQMPGMPLPYVMSDNIAGAKLLTNHLLELGHTQIAFISSPIDGTSSLQKRFEGYSQCLKEAGLTVNPDYQFDSIQFTDMDEDYDSLQVKSIEDFLRCHPEVTAVFATRYRIAEHVYAAAKNIRKEVPEDLSIGCFDGPFLKSHHWQFTHIRQDEKSIATEAVRFLMNLLSDNQADSSGRMGVFIPPKLVIGHTTRTKS